MITTSLKILQAARVDDLRSSAETLASVVRRQENLQLPRASRSRRHLVLWLLARDRKRSEAMAKFLE
jgi:hypothetical protein